MNKIKFKISSVTDKGLVRKENEDSNRTAETPNGYLCVVCDGMGGHAGGEKASSLAVECIIQYLSKEVYPDVRQSLREALEFANMQIIGTASEHPELRGMGSTACVVLLQEGGVWLAHAGDSRIYLYVAKENRLHRLTQDHSYVQGLVNQGMITDAEAEKHPDKNRILKALGTSETLNPEVCHQAVLPSQGDIFLICSDGLSGMVSDKLIEEILSEETDLQHKENALMSMAKSAGGTDNITIQMALITKSPYKRSVFESKNPISPPKDATAPSWRRYIVLAAAAMAGILIGILLNESITHKNPVWKIFMPADSTKIETKDTIPPPTANKVDSIANKNDTNIISPLAVDTGKNSIIDTKKVVENVEKIIGVSGDTTKKNKKDEDSNRRQAQQ
ncbi:MAG: Stp1/IreP family PP2C-type Ser/Thr phosphatase [Bacteroidales bacterium]|jgi:protein phosphatase|nr:Stp1/IreP family PP2C-type Ser/Thr phosphatase [Bacteroidales bacterium]